jgi:hypothetical protein
MKKIQSSNLVFQLNSDPFIIDRIITNSATMLFTEGRQSILVRTPRCVSDPVFIDHFESAQAIDNGYKLHFSDDSGAFRTTLVIQSCEYGIRFHMHVSGPEPLWLVEWKLSGLNLNQVVIPALGGQAVSDDMPDGTNLAFKYPFWWNAQFVIGLAEKGGVWLRSMDTSPTLKLLRVCKNKTRFEWTFGREAPAPLTAHDLEMEWYLDGFDGGWQGPVQIHRQWMERAFNLQPLPVRTTLPSWARGINLILEIWGARKDSPVPHHTFKQMVQRLQQWQKLHPPQNTLVYVPGFAEHGIDSRAPSYRPSELCGGSKAFTKLIDAAHDMGYKVMIHTNVLAMTFSHPLYSKFAPHQVMDVFGRPQGWGLDMDGDWLTEPYFAYINPGAREWGDLMEKNIGDLIREFHVDGVFLDQTLLAFNVSNGPNFLTGMRNHMDRLQRAFPGILFAGEGMHEHIAAPLAMAQIHGLDSIAEVHGQDHVRPWRTVHPVSAFLFGNYIKFTAHLLTRHPSHADFARQEKAYTALNVIPALCLYNAHQEMDVPVVHEMLARARKLETLS